MSLQLKYIDIGILSLLTIGVFLIYVIYAISYFLRVDKKIKLDISGKKHGLSRMCLQGIFFLFGLLIFDLTCEFGQVYLNSYINYDQKIKIIDSFMNNSFSFYSLINKYQLLPISLFINGMFIVSFFYIGVEGLISSLRTMNIEVGLRIELPESKRKRLANIFYIWCFLSVITTVYTILIGSDEVNFYNKNCIFSTIATLTIVILSERSASALENVKIIKTSNEKVNMNIIENTTNNDISLRSLVNTINNTAYKIAENSTVASDKNDINILENELNISDDIGK